jgi:hypothetical protein
MDEIEEEYDEDLLVRQARLLYPDVDDFILELIVHY